MPSIGGSIPGIDEEERKARNIVFHSERHFSAVKLSQHGDKRQIKLSTGHKSDAVCMSDPIGDMLSFGEKTEAGCFVLVVFESKGITG